MHNGSDDFGVILGEFPNVICKEALPACKETYSGPEGTDYCTDLNVSEGKAYEKSC